MLRCPSCGHTFSQFTIEGWTSYVQTVVSLDKRNVIANVAPFLVLKMVEIGESVHEEMDIICPSCNARHKPSQYAQLSVCDVTGQPSTQTASVTLHQITYPTVQRSYTLTVNIADDVVPLLHHSFDLGRYMYALDMG